MTIETDFQNVGQIMEEQARNGNTSGTFTVNPVEPTPEQPPEPQQPVTLIYED